jgi:hypothetical protein
MQVPEARDEAAVEALIAAVQAASAGGSWFFASLADSGFRRIEALRRVVLTVWPQQQSSHHPNFSFWLLLPAGPDGVPQDAQEWAARNAVFLLGAAAVFLRYSTDFDTERQIRDLVVAAHDLNLYATQAHRAALALMQPADAIDVFRAARRADVFAALVEGADADMARYIAAARDRAGFSALDVAIARNYGEAAEALVALGCRSERFDFDMLLDPALAELVRKCLALDGVFPFDPRRSLARVALGGRLDLVARLFDMRADRDFAALDYPLLEACAHGDPALLHAVLDRMGTTGVHPYRDDAICAAFLPKLLVFGTRHEEPAAGRDASPLKRQWDATGHGPEEQPLNVLTRSVLSRMGLVLQGERRVVRDVPLEALQRLAPFPQLLRQLVPVLEPAMEPRTAPRILAFFIQHFPEATVETTHITEGALECMQQLGPRDMEQQLLHLLRQMVQVGPRGHNMLRTALAMVRRRDAVDLKRRMAPLASDVTYAASSSAVPSLAAGPIVGPTLLHSALFECRPPNVGAIRLLLEACGSDLQRERFLSQTDGAVGDAPYSAFVRYVLQAIGGAPLCVGADGAPATIRYEAEGGAFADALRVALDALHHATVADLDARRGVYGDGDNLALASDVTRLPRDALPLAAGSGDPVSRVHDATLYDACVRHGFGAWAMELRAARPLHAPAIASLILSAPLNVMGLMVQRALDTDRIAALDVRFAPAERVAAFWHQRRAATRVYCRSAVGSAERCALFDFLAVTPERLEGTDDTPLLERTYFERLALAARENALAFLGDVRLMARVCSFLPPRAKVQARAATLTLAAAATTFEAWEGVVAPPAFVPPAPSPDATVTAGSLPQSPNGTISLLKDDEHALARLRKAADAEEAAAAMTPERCAISEALVQGVMSTKVKSIV